MRVDKAPVSGSVLELTKCTIQVMSMDRRVKDILAEITVPG